MPHGQRDWSNIGADTVVHGLADMAELAARLGSPDTHNREGNVVLLETFEHGLSGWNLTPVGAGSGVVVSAESYRSSGYSCKLVAGSTSPWATEIFRKLPFPAASKYGLELSVRFGADVNYISFHLVHHDGVQEYQFSVQYRVAARDLRVRDADGSMVVVAANLNLPFAYAGFHTLKLVGDFIANRYVRLIVNDMEYDLAAYAAYPWASSDSAHVRAVIDCIGNAGYNGYIYVDDVILTQNEPA